MEVVYWKDVVSSGEILDVAGRLNTLDPTLLFYRYMLNEVPEDTMVVVGKYVYYILSGGKYLFRCTCSSKGTLKYYRACIKSIWSLQEGQKLCFKKCNEIRVPMCEEQDILNILKVSSGEVGIHNIAKGYQVSIDNRYANLLKKISLLSLDAITDIWPTDNDTVLLDLQEGKDIDCETEVEEAYVKVDAAYLYRNTICVQSIKVFRDKDVSSCVKIKAPDGTLKDCVFISNEYLLTEICNEVRNVYAKYL